MAIRKFTVCFILFFIITSFFIYSEQISDPEYGYILDVPEGYSLKDNSKDSMAYLFSHDRLPVHLILRLYGTEIYKTPEQALGGSLNKLNAEFTPDVFNWRNTPCSVSDFNMKLNGKEFSGWGVGILLNKKSANLVILCYCDSEKIDYCRQFIISTLNWLSIDRGSFYSPGIITSYAFPENKIKKISMEIEGKKIKTSIREDDLEASQFVLDCEYAVLKFYAENPKWKEAWCRYYKNIFRDSFARFKIISFNIYNSLYPIARKRNSKNPDASLNEILLNWVQNFEYKRTQIETSSDFTNLIAAIIGEGSDCDSRSLLMCVLLEQMNIKTALFISPKYSHAIYGAQIDEEGAKINVEGKEYLLGETTAKSIKPGLIAQEMSVTENWIPIIFP